MTELYQDEIWSTRAEGIGKLLKISPNKLYKDWTAQASCMKIWMQAAYPLPLRWNQQGVTHQTRILIGKMWHPTYREFNTFCRQYFLGSTYRHSTEPIAYCIGRLNRQSLSQDFPDEVEEAATVTTNAVGSLLPKARSAGA